MRATLAALMLFLGATLCRAQVPASFYNLTGIKVKKLSNAVQLTLQTDGAVRYQLDYTSLYRIDSSGDFQGGTTTAVRFRLIGARTRLPSFTSVAAYPVDAVVAAPGTAPLPQLFPDESEPFDPTIPNVDVEVRTYIPIGAQEVRSGEFEESRNQLLPPLTARIEVGQDRRSIQITVITDRVDTDRLQARMQRSPVAERHRKVEVGGSGPSDLTVHALHAPLGELAPLLSERAGVPLAVQPDSLTAEVSANLTGATLGEVLRLLSVAAGLGVTPLEGGGFLLGKSGEALVTDRIPLRYLDPRTARLLLPDFLLPSIRADLDVNALIVTATPEVVRRIRADLELLDLPRPQVKVTATAYELELTDEEQLALTATVSDRNGTQTLSGDSGTLTSTLSPGRLRTLSAALDAAKTRGRARLVSEPSLVVASGTTGTLFVGQDRFLTVLRQTFFGQVPQAIKIAVGTSVALSPKLAPGGEILLTVAPRFATVLSREAGSGLPTLGVREMSSTLRVAPGETVLVAGLDTALSESFRRRTAPRSSKTRLRSSFLLLIRAEPAPESVTK